MRTPDIVGPGYLFYPVMLMMFAFAVVVAGPGEALVRVVIWLVAVCNRLRCPLGHCVQVGAS
jgi:hypothetical protein